MHFISAEGGTGNSHWVSRSALDFGSGLREICLPVSCANSFRDKDARDFYNEFDAPPINALLASHPFEVFETADHCVRLLVGILFISLRGELDRIRDGKLWNRAVAEEMIETAKTFRHAPSHLDDVNSSIKARFDRLKADSETR